MVTDRGKLSAGGKGEKHLTQNVTVRRVRITNVAVENKHVLHILSVCL